MTRSDLDVVSNNSSLSTPVKPVLRRPHPTLILRRSKSLAATRIRLTKPSLVFAEMG